MLNWKGRVIQLVCYDSIFQLSPNSPFLCMSNCSLYADCTDVSSRVWTKFTFYVECTRRGLGFGLRSLTDRTGTGLDSGSTNVITKGKWELNFTFMMYWLRNWGDFSWPTHKSIVKWLRDFEKRLLRPTNITHSYVYVLYVHMFIILWLNLLLFSFFTAFYWGEGLLARQFVLFLIPRPSFPFFQSFRRYGFLLGHLIYSWCFF